MYDNEHGVGEAVRTSGLDRDEVFITSKLSNAFHRPDDARRVTESWSPLAQAKVLRDPAVQAIAERLGRAPSQVVLRWHIDRGDVVFPKSMSALRMRENMDIFGFELASDDIEAISALQQGEAARIGPHPDTFDWIPG